MQQTLRLSWHHHRSRSRPKVFYLLPKIDLGVDRMSAFGIQGGFQHESNGKSGEDSRSTNYLYMKPVS